MSSVYLGLDYRETELLEVLIHDMIQYCSSRLAQYSDSSSSTASSHVNLERGMYINVNPRMRVVSIRLPYRWKKSKREKAMMKVRTSEAYGRLGEKLLTMENRTFRWSDQVNTSEVEIVRDSEAMCLLSEELIYVLIARIYFSIKY